MRGARREPRAVEPASAPPGHRGRRGSPCSGTVPDAARAARARSPGRPGRARRRAEPAQLARDEKRKAQRRTAARRGPGAAGRERNRGSEPPLPRRRLASTRTSSSTRRARRTSRSSVGDSGSAIARPARHQQTRLIRATRPRAVPRSARSSRPSASCATDGRGSGAQPLSSQRRVVEKRRIASASAAGRSRRHEQAVLAVAHDLGHTADRRRDHRRADGQRLDDGVREVLPGGRRAAPRPPRRTAARTSSRDPGRENAPGSPRPRATARSLETVRGRGRRRARGASTAGASTSASSATSSAFCAVSRPAKATSKCRRRRARRAARRATAAPGRRAPGSAPRHVASGRGPTPSAIRRRYSLGRDHERGAPCSAAVRVARSAPHARRPPRRLWNSSSVPVEAARPPRALVRLVGDELHDERTPRDARAPRRGAGAPCSSRRRRPRRGHGARRAAADRRMTHARGSAPRTQCTGYGSAAGAVDAVVTTSTP